MNNSFELPIYYLDNKEELSDEIKKDLELLKKTNNEMGLYKNIFDTESKFGRNMIVKWSKYYTSNKDFLKESQEIYNKIETNEYNLKEEEEIINIVSKIKTSEKFEDTYLYLKDLYGYEVLNENYTFMLYYTIILILSPILSLLMPLMFLIIPYALLRYNKIKISLGVYLSTLKMILCKMPVCKMVLTGDIKPSNLVTILFSGGMYIVQIYQNICQCIRLKNYLLESQKELNIIKGFIKESINNMDKLLTITKNMKTYQNFNNNLEDNKIIINNYLKRLENLSDDKLNLLQNVGRIRSEYYNLYLKKENINILEYICEFNGYIRNINSIKENISIGRICKAVYSKKNTKMKKMYYPEIKESVVKNNILLNNNKLITGVNASGKTTLIKTILLNIILSQQIGYGFYEKGRIRLYDKLHCYLNIPDTSSRDSLFQAEARRCKRILDDIIKYNMKEHFCIFDELYSGTNPIEASMAGYGYLKYLNKYKNVKFILTTHYTDMCNKLEETTKNKSIVNNNMNAYYKDNKLNCSYRLCRGIAKLNGGVEVLKKLNYDKKIIDVAMSYSKDVFV